MQSNIIRGSLQESTRAKSCLALWHRCTVNLMRCKLERIMRNYLLVRFLATHPSSNIRYLLVGPPVEQSPWTLCLRVTMVNCCIAGLCQVLSLIVSITEELRTYCAWSLANKINPYLVSHHKWKTLLNVNAKLCSAPVNESKLTNL